MMFGKPMISLFPISRTCSLSVLAQIHIRLCVWKYSTRSNFLFCFLFLFYFHILLSGDSCIPRVTQADIFLYFVLICQTTSQKKFLEISSVQEKSHLIVKVLGDLTKFSFAFSHSELCIQKNINKNAQIAVSVYSNSFLGYLVSL